MHPDVERLIALMPAGPESGERLDWLEVERELDCRLISVTSSPSTVWALLTSA